MLEGSPMVSGQTVEAVLDMLVLSIEENPGGKVGWQVRMVRVNVGAALSTPDDPDLQFGADGKKLSLRARRRMAAEINEGDVALRRGIRTEAAEEAIAALHGTSATDQRTPSQERAFRREAKGFRRSALRGPKE